jgi:D-glycero-alpha-D-manno-heptose-7-phosphate kinase
MGGFVCNLAITRHAAVTFRDSAALTQRVDDLTAAALRRAQLDGVSVELTTDFPPGAGLGGSSAVGVALQAAIASWREETVDRDELARRSRGVEVEELGVAGGWQDHYAAAFGGALGLTFADDVAVRRLRIDDAFAAELERRCVVAYTGESRISGATITAVLDAYRERAPHVVRALAHMAALARTMADAMAEGSLDDLGELVDEHWTHQRALHPRITTAGIERALTAAHEAGALGGKALGASGGGCVLAIARAGRERDVRDAMSRVATLVPFGVDRHGVRVERLAQAARA